MTIFPQGPDQPMVAQAAGYGHPLTRMDNTGRSIAFGDSRPRTRSVLYTGAPGMGTSFELDRAAAYAKQNGAAVIRVDASSREPLENRFARSVGDQLGELRKKYGFFAVRSLKKTVQKLIARKQNAQNGVEIRTPSPGGLLPQFVGKHQWDAKGSEDPGRTLNDLADQLGDLAGKGNGTAVIVIDNVEQASDRDLAAINELAAHLERSGRPVHLVMGGGEAAPTRLMQASMRGSGIESDIGRLYDIRECKPFADYQLQWAATDYMARRGFPMQPDAAQALVRSANGNLSRLYRDAAAAASIAQPPYGVTLATAQAAIKLENERYAPVYEAKWNNSSDAEKTLMAQAAQRGSRGIDVRRMAANLEPAERNELLATAKNLEFRGILRQDATGRWVFADEGMRQQVMTEVGTPGVYQTVPIQPDLAQTAQTQQQAPTQQVDPVVRFLAGQTPLVLGSATGHGARPETAASRGTSPQDRGGREQ